MKRRQAAVFLDRDGTLIQDLIYATDATRVKPIPGAIRALRQLRDRGFQLILISNQSGVGRGLISPRQFYQVHLAMIRMLRRRGIELAGAYYCPHAPEAGCSCRKPSPQLVFRAAEEHNIDMARSVFIGNKAVDVETGNNAGLRSILLDPAACSESEDHSAKCWRKAAGQALALKGKAAND